MTLKYLSLFLESGCTKEMALEACLDQGGFPGLPTDVLHRPPEFRVLPAPFPDIPTVSSAPAWRGIPRAGL